MLKLSIGFFVSVRWWAVCEDEPRSDKLCELTLRC